MTQTTNIKELMLQNVQEERDNRDSWEKKDVESAIYYINLYTFMDELYEDAVFGGTITYSVGKIIRYAYHKAVTTLEQKLD